MRFDDRVRPVQNEELQPPLPSQGPPGQQGYGWQYDQEYPEAGQPAAPLPLRLPPPPGQPSYGPPPTYRLDEHSPQLPAHYQQPIADMGSSLSYGQGMEYQYLDAPQPSQPIAQLRQERLQQLREERMRRQQRRMGDFSSMLPWRGKGPKEPAQFSPRGMNGAGTPSQPLLQPPVSQMSPSLSPHTASQQDIMPIRASTLPPPNVLEAAASAGPSAQRRMQSAAVPAQDTGMIQRMRIGKAAMIITGAFVASRVLGLLRTSMFSYVFGASNISDAYLQAFLIPDLIFNVVAGGALSSAFIPAFVGERSEKRAWRLASSALNLAVAIMVMLAVLAIIFAPYLVPLYTPAASKSELVLIVSLTRIMLLQSIALGGGVIVTSVLQAKQDFMLPAVGTVLYNVGTILGLLPGVYLSLHNPLAQHPNANDIVAVYWVTWGVVVGAILQVGAQIPGLLKLKMRYSFSFDWRDPTILQIGRQMVPRIINAAMLYFSIFVDRGLIGLLAGVAGAVGTNGLITQYNQALQLVLLPLSIFGMSMSTAAFPALAENVTKGRIDRVRNTILETLRSILFMSIPSSIGLIVLALPIIQVLYEHGQFHLSDAEATAVPMAFFALGLAGLSAVEILTRSFYAFRDSKTPVIISIGQFLFKIMLSLILIDVSYFWGPQWGMGALAFSTSTAALLEASLLFWLLRDRVEGMQLRPVGIFIGRVLLASLAMGVVLLVLSRVLDLVLVTTNQQALGFGGTLLAVIKLLIELFVGVFVYIRVSRRLGIEELELGPVKRLLERLKLSWI
jgi:putative peptidoglycan lipid II flippase